MRLKPMRLRHWKAPSPLPGFRFSFGITVIYLGVVILLPLSALVFHAAGLGIAGFFEEVSRPRVLAAFRVSLTTAFAAALINLVFGLIVAWVLVRYSFPGRRIADALVDLPFALPTAVAGIALTNLYAPNGWIGQVLELAGVKVAFTPLGIIVALTFIGLPFVVRTVQPVLEDFQQEQEDASSLLGATRWQTFWRVIFPSIQPALLTGFMLAFARGLGEYGSVIFIAGNLPGISEIVPLLIVIKLEQFDYKGATAIATLMLVLSLGLLLVVNTLQSWARSRHAG